MGIVHFYSLFFSAVNKHLWKSMFVQLLTVTNVSNASLLLLSDVPILRDLGPNCMPTFFKPRLSCGTSLVETQRRTAVLHELLTELALEGAHVMDFQPLLCDQDEC